MKIIKWSKLLQEVQFNRSMIIEDGEMFLYDSGSLPQGLTGIKAGDVLVLNKDRGIAAAMVLNDQRDWIVIKTYPGTGAQIDDSLVSLSNEQQELRKELNYLHLYHGLEGAIEGFKRGDDMDYLDFLQYDFERRK